MLIKLVTPRRCTIRHFGQMKRLAKSSTPCDYVSRNSTFIVLQTKITGIIKPLVIIRLQFVYLLSLNQEHSNLVLCMNPNNLDLLSLNRNNSESTMDFLSSLDMMLVWLRRSTTLTLSQVLRALQ